jgi:transposase
VRCCDERDSFRPRSPKWRKIINQQSQEALSRKRGPKTNPLRAKVRELEYENERLRSELAKSRRVIYVQGKVSALLEELSLGSTEDQREQTQPSSRG